MLFLLSTHHMAFLTSPAKLIFAEAKAKDKALNTPPQQEIPPSTSWAARTERQYAFDQSQVKTLGLAYAPPDNLSNNSTPPSSDTSIDSEPSQPEQSSPLPQTPKENTQAPILPQQLTVPEQSSPLVPPQDLTAPDVPSRTESHAHIKKTESPPNSTQQLDLTLPLSQQTKATKAAPPAQAQQKKSSLTLAQLTSGFIAHMANKPGDSAVSINGDKNKKPTAEQLIFERYQEKTYHCLLQSNNRYNNRYPDIAKYQTLELQILVTYHANGLAQNISLLSSSGHKEFDDYCMFIFKDASTSFPPVPPSFLKAHNSYSIPFTILSSPHDNNWLKVRR